MKTYKLKSLMYLTAFILSALAYHYIQENEQADAAQHTIVTADDTQPTATQAGVF